MAANEHPVDEAATSVKRFKMPKLFAEVPAPPAPEEVGDEEGPRKGLLASAEALKATIAVAPAPEVETKASSPAGVPRPDDVEVARDNNASRDFDALRAEVEEISRTLEELNERGLTQDRIFDTLHNELQDYKNDFIYEHLKPVVRPLLFLFDSIEQFDNELAVYEVEPNRERRGGITPTVVRENIVYFREQLVESLRICEVTPMERPHGAFDARLHKAMSAVEVEADQNNTIQRVLRSGWYLNGRVFRPAEVVVGKSRDEMNAHVWDKGKAA